MTQDSEELKRKVSKQSENLARYGMEISKIQFSYKIKEKTSKDYWEERISLFKKYSECSLQYYDQAYFMIRLINEKEAQMFLLRISKFRQLVSELVKLMEKIKTNTSIINSKDKQQSIWSKDIRQQIIEHSNTCLSHEKDTNMAFREFYEKHLRKMLE